MKQVALNVVEMKRKLGFGMGKSDRKMVSYEILCLRDRHAKLETETETTAKRESKRKGVHFSLAVT